MNENQNGSDDESLNRRGFIVTTGALGISALLAGCGDGGPGVETTEPGGTPMGTDTPSGTETPTDGDTATDTEAESPTEGESPTDEESPTETEAGTETGDVAQLRAAHLSPNAPNVDVYVDESLALEDVPFGAVSSYQELAAGSHAVEITAAGDPETSVFEADVTLEAGMVYTLAALGEVGEDVDQPFEPMLLTDENEPPDGETARVRAVHASPDAPAVDITANGTVLFDGVSFGDSAYTEVPAGEYTIEIRGDTEENDGEVVATFDVSLEGGQVYSAFAAGYLAPEEAPEDTAFDLIVTQDTEGE